MNTIQRDFAFVLGMQSDAVCLLLVPSDDGYGLFSLKSEPHFWQSCESLERAVREQLGFTAYTLRCLLVEHGDDDPPARHCVYAMQWGGGSEPPGARWLTRDQLADIPLASTHDHAALYGWLTQMQSEPVYRPAWSRFGWRESIYASLPDRLARHGLRLTAPPVAVRVWERGAVLRLPSDQGNVYLKSVPPVFGHEPALTVWLSERFPSAVPDLLDIADGMLMRDYGGAALFEQPDLALWEGGLRAYARLQVALCGHLDALRALAVPQRSLDWLCSELPSFFSDVAALRIGTNPLMESEIERLRLLLPRFMSACSLLAEGAVPLSLEHGDLWTGQIIARNGQFIISDWSDSAITHPFFSLPFFVAEIANELPGVPDARERLTTAYLSEWTAFAALPELQALMLAAATVSAVYTALRYHLDILPAMENRWEMANMLAYNLRLALREVDQIDGEI